MTYILFHIIIPLSRIHSINHKIHIDGICLSIILDAKKNKNKYIYMVNFVRYHQAIMLFFRYQHLFVGSIASNIYLILRLNVYLQCFNSLIYSSL